MKRLIQMVVAGSLIAAATACQLIEVPILTFYSIKGIEVGVPSMPYYCYSKAGLEGLNREMEEAGVPVTLADAFNAAYGETLSEIDPDGRTGKININMKQATRSFQKILKAKKVPNAGHYILTIIDTARDQGLILFAAVYRPRLLITVPAKYDPSIIQTLNPENPDFYLPYQNDDKGRLDTVYEWAALPVQSYHRHSHQAVLFALTANKILEKKQKPEYWNEEKKWLAGDYMSVAREQDKIYCEFLGIEEGFSEEF